MSLLSFLNFAKEDKNIEITSQTGKKLIPWGDDNMFPQHLLKLYDTVPEHTSSIDFIIELTTNIGLNTDDFDYWTVKKFVSDFIIFGGIAIKNVKLNSGEFKPEYIDISKLRLTEENNKVGYCEKWGEWKTKVEWYDIISNEFNKTGIYIYKNIKSREKYPRPYYISSGKSIETLSKIIDYHNNNAENGFVPNLVINIPNVTDEKVQELYERNFKKKFTGTSSQKFVLAFPESNDTKITFEKLQNDNLDEKFKDLQIFLRDEIIIGHKLTSGSLIGVRQTNTGFSKQEYDESLQIFKDVVISGLQNELLYIFKMALKNENVIFNENVDENIKVDNNNK